MERFRLLDVPVATQAHGGGHCDGAVDVGCAFTRHVAVCPSGIEQLVFPNTVGMPLRRTLSGRVSVSQMLLRSGLDPAAFHDRWHCYAT
jgi:hypothetical protein